LPDVCMLAIIAIRPMNLRSKIIFRLGGNGSVSFLCATVRLYLQ
jgi:hypothetical protein